MTDWQCLFDDYAPTGSRVICSPPPMDTDEDFVCLSRRPVDESLREIGFVEEGRPEFYTGNDAGEFRSWRRGETNLIVTRDLEFFDLFGTATALAKRFNLTSKADRIALFQAVLYGVAPHNLVEAAE